MFSVGTDAGGINLLNLNNHHKIPLVRLNDPSWADIVRVVSLYEPARSDLMFIEPDEGES